MSTIGGPRLSTIPTFQNTYSMDFDGVDDVLSLGENSTVGTGGTNTLSFWVKGGAQSVVTISDYLFSSYGTYNWWKYFHGHDTNLYWRNINGVAFNVAPNVFDGDWHNIVIIRNPSDLVDGSLRIYVDNGTPLDRTLDYRYGVAGFYNGPLGTIGNNITASSGFNGKIDEVSVWDSEITPSDVSTIYNGGAPNDLTDLSPDYWLRNGDNGSWKSPQWLLPSNENKDKVSNYSFQLDGINDYIDLGDSDDFSFGDGATDSPFSISAWIKMDSTSGFRIFNKYSGSINEYQFGTGGAQKLQMYIFDNTSSFKYRARVYNTILNTGQWYHVATTYSGVGGSNAQDGIKIYVNGVRVDDSSVSGGAYVAMGNKTTPVYIGKLDSSYANGNIDEVSLFNSELSASDITDIYNGGEPTTLPSGAVVHYRLGEEATFSGGVWTVPDQVGTNDGTSANMTIEDRVGSAPSISNNAVSFNMDLIDRTTDVPT